MTKERINAIMQYFDRDFLCKPYSEVDNRVYGIQPPVTAQRSSIDTDSAYPELPEYKQASPTIGVDWGSDISKEMSLLQGYTFAIGKMNFNHDGTVIWDDVTNIIQTYAVDGDLTPYRVDMRLEEFWIRGVLYSKNEDLSMPAIIELIHKRLKGDASVLFDYELSISQGGFK